MEGRSKRLSSVLEPSVDVEAVKGQRGDRYTRAQMMEGGDECILSREKPGIRNIRLDRGIKGREYVSPPPVEGRCERTFRICKAESATPESTRTKEEREREREYLLQLYSRGSRNNRTYVNNLRGNSNKS